MKKVTTSKQFSLGWHDILKGLAVAILTPVLFVIQQTADRGELVFNWKSIAMAAISGGLGYLLKNFFASPKVTITAHSNEQAENLKENLE